MYRKVQEMKTRDTIAQSPPPSVTQYNSKDYQFTHPLLLEDVGGESTDMYGLKNDITPFINGKVNSGELTSAAVYVRRLNDGHWFSINNNDVYNAGSMLKVPVMMAYLRQGEKNPGMLSMKYFVTHNDQVPLQTYNDGTIVPDKSYPVKDLLYFMITRSDNYATLALNEHVNIQEYQNLFASIGIPKPNMKDRN